MCKTSGASQSSSTSSSGSSHSIVSGKTRERLPDLRVERLSHRDEPHRESLAQLALVWAACLTLASCTHAPPGSIKCCQTSNRASPRALSSPVVAAAFVGESAAAEFPAKAAVSASVDTANAR
jgi:hypothetical protein